MTPNRNAVSERSLGKAGRDSPQNGPSSIAKAAKRRQQNRSAVAASRL